MKSVLLPVNKHLMDKLQRLQELLKQKKSKKFYSERLGITIQEVEELLEELRNEAVDLDIEGTTQKYNFDKGTVEISAFYKTPPTPEQVIKDHKIDENNYKLSAFYSKGKGDKGWLVTGLFKNITKEEQIVNSFQEFLKTYKSDYKPIQRLGKVGNSPSSLIFNKQDAHQNKMCTSGTGNDIFDRFTEYETNVDKTLRRASKLSSIEKVVYIIGSDQFNSEVTGMTVKGTPQTNILNYHLSFQLVCDHETKVIKRFLETSDEVEVIYLVGNHDACVSFHLASWLKVYFRDEKRVSVDINTDFTKYFSLYDTAIGINHGDVQKPERLAQNFPLEYKKGFAEANHHVLITGDKHTELSKDIGGIKFFQIPALSKAKGSWEKQMGYTTTPAQMTTFMIEPENGVSIIFKETL